MPPNASSSAFPEMTRQALVRRCVALPREIRNRIYDLLPYHGHGSNEEGTRTLTHRLSDTESVIINLTAIPDSRLLHICREVREELLEQIEAFAGADVVLEKVYAFPPISIDPGPTFIQNVRHLEVTTRYDSAPDLAFSNMPLIDHLLRRIFPNLLTLFVSAEGRAREMCRHFEALGARRLTDEEIDEDGAPMDEDLLKVTISGAREAFELIGYRCDFLVKEEGAG